MIYFNKKRRTPKPRTNNILDRGIRYSHSYSSGGGSAIGDSSNFLKKNGSEDQYVNTFVNFQGVTKINNHEIWTKEQIQMLNKYLLFLGDKINAGHADNAKLWDNRLFEEFLNQPVRSDSSVVFDNITGGNVVASSYKTKNFTPGVLGTGVGTVGSDIHADSLYLRKMLVVTEMLIQKMRHQGGQIVLSSAGVKLIRIEEQEMFYRCYFDNCDNKINNLFVIDDQVRCQTFDGDIRYYWRLVTGAGIDYIDLSKTDVDGISTPEIGDELVQLGNRTDVNRRGATIISSVGTEIGLFVYANIDSFSLEGKQISWIGQLGSEVGGEFTGKVTFSNGSSGLEHCVEWPNISNEKIAEKLGYDTYEEFTSLPVGETIIQGGFLNTNIIKVGSITANQLHSDFIYSKQINVNDKFIVDSAGNMTCVDGNFIGEIEARSGTIAGFNISGNMIGTGDTSSGEGLAIFNSFIKFRGGSRSAMIGENVLPASSGLYAVGNFVNSTSNLWGNNYGILVEVKNADRNFAIKASAGHIISNDSVMDANTKALIDGDNTTEISLKRGRIVYVYNHTYRYIYLPDKQDVLRDLGVIDEHDRFWIEILIVANHGNGNPFLLSFKPNEGQILDHNANVIPNIRMEKGDSVRILLYSIFDRYYAQVINRNY